MRLAMGVSIMPGWRIATRMLKGFTSWASASLRASRANFDAEYGARGEQAMRPAIEVTLMMHPLRLSRISGKNVRVQRNAPK